MILKGCIVIFCLICINLFTRHHIAQKKAKSHSNKDLLIISFIFSSLLLILTLAMLAIGTEFDCSIQSLGLFIIYWSNMYGLLKVWRNAE